MSLTSPANNIKRCEQCGKPRRSLTVIRGPDENFLFCFFCLKDMERKARKAEAEQAAEDHEH